MGISLPSVQPVDVTDSTSRGGAAPRAPPGAGVCGAWRADIDEVAPATVEITRAIRNACQRIVRIISDSSSNERQHTRSQWTRLLGDGVVRDRSEEHTSELQSLRHLVCRLLLEK